MTLVLDASLTLSWYFEDERTDDGDALLDRVAGSGAIVPGLWRYEVANGFLTAIRRKRIDSAYRDASLADLRLFPITVDSESEAVLWTATLRVADRFGLTIYDAAYVELADRRGLPLATRDRAMREAAGALTIEVLG
jgi:predicted nucleic acid-binding protein